RTADGPLTETQRQAFTGLRYFAPDLAWKVTAAFEPLAPPDTVRFVTSKGTFEPYLRAGHVRFTHRGTPLELTVYRSPGGDRFLPFTDPTTGEATYGAGRYLDLDVPGAAPSLDFNRAYNPYCAYNASWVCPVAPPENHLQIAVEAGEKRYGNGH